MKINFNKKGQVIIIAALFMIILLSITGFMIDVGFLYLQKAKIKNACDAAALAGARDLSTTDTSTAISTAQTYAISNGISPSDITITTPYDGDSNKIGIVIAKRVPFHFMRILGYTSSVVKTRCVATRFNSGQGNLLPLVVPDTAVPNCILWGPNNQCNDIAPSGGGGPLSNDEKGLVDLGCCSESADVLQYTDCTPYTAASPYVSSKPQNINSWVTNGCNCNIYIGNDLCLYNGTLGANMATPLKNACNAQGLSDGGGAYGLFMVLVYDKIFGSNNQHQVNISGYAKYKVYCNNISQSSASGTFVEYVISAPNDELVPALSLVPGLYE